MLKSIQLCIERNGGHVENQVGNFSMWTEVTIEA
jgi:hypothetical protein